MADLHSKYTCRLVYIIQCTCSHESTVSVSGRLRDVVEYNEQNSRFIAAAGRPAHFTRMPISDPNCVKLDHYNATLDRDKRRCSVKWMIEHMFRICFYRCMYVKFTIPNIINMIVVFSESFRASRGRGASLFGRHALDPPPHTYASVHLFTAVSNFRYFNL